MAPEGKIFIDNKTVLSNQIGMEELERMYDQPDRFHLSNYLQNKVAKKR